MPPRKLGYRNRGLTPFSLPIFPPELLLADEALRALVHQRAPEAALRAAALAQGMTLLRDDGTRLLALGLTSPEELLRVTRE